MDPENFNKKNETQNCTRNYHFHLKQVQKKKDESGK